MTDHMRKNTDDGKPADISYVAGGSRFKYRVCGIMLRGGKVLTVRDERSPYRYLPGGKVRLGETAEHAAVREIEEELGITPRIVRPLWLNQGFFSEDVDKLTYHELCVYFLLDISGTDLAERGERFTLREESHTLEFEWVAIERLKDEYFYPGFLKTEIADLPELFPLRSEFE